MIKIYKQKKSDNVDIKAENKDVEENDNNSEKETQIVLQNFDFINSYDKALLQNENNFQQMIFQYVKNLETHFQHYLVKEKKKQKTRITYFFLVSL